MAQYFVLFLSPLELPQLEVLINECPSFLEYATAFRPSVLLEKLLFFFWAVRVDPVK